MLPHELAAKLKKIITEISPTEAHQRRASNATIVILDVREENEWNDGHIPLAEHLPRGLLEKHVEQLIPDKTTPIICQCRSGMRSLLAADTLKKLGYTNVASMAGGIMAWQELGFPVDHRESALSESERVRYARHLALPEIGEAGQQKLLQAKVLIIGGGGLGSSASLYLAAAGVGTIGIVDCDVVDLSNLQRQILHTTDRVGMAKVESAKLSLQGLNPGVRVEAHRTKLTRENAAELFRPYDIIVDGSDNFPTRYLASDACLLLDKPYVYGGLHRFEGEASLFWPQRSGPCYRCLYPEPPPPEQAPNCAEAGVIGVVPGIIGLLQAMEAIKLILERGEYLAGRLVRFDALRTTFREFTISPDPSCRCNSKRSPERICHV